MTDWGRNHVYEEPGEGWHVAENPLEDIGARPADLSAPEGLRWLRETATVRLRSDAEFPTAAKIFCSRHRDQGIVCRVRVLPKPWGAVLLSYLDNGASDARGARSWFCWLLDVDAPDEIAFSCPASHDVFIPAASVLDAVEAHRLSGVSRAVMA